jgi:hypothetical protein
LALYFLCLYHLFKKIREGLGKRKDEQKIVKDLLLSNQIDRALARIKGMAREANDQKEKDHLIKLYIYISRNQQGIPTNLNKEWNLWWEEGRKQNLKVGKFNPPLSASYFKEDTESLPLIEVSIPARVGPDQDKPWVGVLKNNHAYLSK